MIRHTCLFGELQGFPVGKCSLCQIFLGFPGRSVFLASAFVVFPVDLVLDFFAENALVDNSTDLIVGLLVVIAVGDGARME
jgi:hypothetical protein